MNVNEAIETLEEVYNDHPCGSYKVISHDVGDDTALYIYDEDDDGEYCHLLCLLDHVDLLVRLELSEIDEREPFMDAFRECAVRRGFDVDIKRPMGFDELLERIGVLVDCGTECWVVSSRYHGIPDKITLVRDNDGRIRIKSVR